MSGSAAAWLALFALIHQLVASHQHSNRILGILRVGMVVAGTGAGVGAGAGAGAQVRACSQRQFVNVKQR